MRILYLTLCLTLAATPLAAQKMGSSNEDAPKVATSVTYSNGDTVKVSYTAITVAGGKTMRLAMDKENGATTRQRINGRADRSPLGKFETSIDLKFAGKTIPKGAYDLAFRIGDDLKWTMTLKSGDEMHSFPMNTGDSGHEMRRLSIVLLPGEAAGTGNLSIAYGALSAAFELEGQAAGDGEEK